MAKLIPCPSCNRHVLASECVCPFCSAARPCTKAERPVTGRALTRAAILFAGATAISACGGNDTAAGDASTDGSSDVANDAKDGNNLPDVVAMYGPAPVDAGNDVSDAAAPDGAPADAGDG